LNEATGGYASAIGYDNVASGSYANAFGFGNEASGERASAFGGGSTAAGQYSLALGYEAAATGADAIAAGRSAEVLATDGVAIGRGAEVGAAAVEAVAIGAGSVATEAGAVSSGDTGDERRLVHVASGTAATDAVNVSQLYDMGSTVASYFGGGAAFAGGAWTAPVYVIQGGSHGNVGDAFAAVDGVLSGLDGRIGAIEALPPGGAPGPQGLSAYEVAVDNGYSGSESDWLTSLVGPQGPAGPGVDGLTEAEVQAIATDVSDAGDATTLAEANDYTDAREDAIRDDMAAGDTATLTAANDYTDVAIQQLVGFDVGGINDRLGALEDRFDGLVRQQDRRIDRMGAMSAAMLNMAINAAGTQSPRGRIAVGAGFQGGEQGLSVGYGKRIGRTASFSLGAAFSSGESSAGIGFGVDL